MGFPWGAAIGAGASLLGGSSARKSARNAQRAQMKLLRKAEGKIVAGGRESQGLLSLLQQTLGTQYNQLAQESRETGEEQKLILGGSLSSARRRADQLLPSAGAGAVLANMNRGITNTTAGLNFEQGALRQAAVAGGELEQSAGGLMSGMLGQIFGRTAGVVAGGLGVQQSLGAAGAQFPMQVGQALGGLWGNVQVQPAPGPDFSWIGQWLATDPFGGGGGDDEDPLYGPGF